MWQKIIILLISIVLLGCTNKNKIGSGYIELSESKGMLRISFQPEQINIKDAEEINTDDFLQMIRSICYLPLSSEELIGEITRMIITKEKIYIMDSFVAQRIFVFDKNGNLQFCIKDKGQGPEEYMSLWDMQIDTLKNEIIVNDALTRSYIYYSANNGKFLRRGRGIANCYLACMNGKYVNLTAHKQDFNESEDWAILVSDKDSILYKGFELSPIQKNDFIVNSFYYDIDKQLLFTPLNSDTIYQLSSDSTYFPKYVINQKKSIWNLRDKNLTENEICELIKENDYTRYSGVFLSTKKHVFFTVAKEWHGAITSEPYFWDKDIDKVYKWKITKPKEIVDIVAKPVAVFDNTFYSVILPYEMENGYPETLNTSLKSILQRSDKDSNPILVLYHLK